jgi:hypothetical protein
VSSTNQNGFEDKAEVDPAVVDFIEKWKVEFWAKAPPEEPTVGHNLIWAIDPIKLDTPSGNDA